MHVPGEPTAEDAHASLAEIGRVGRRIRAGGRWAGWLWLVVGLATAAFEAFAPPVTSGWAGQAVSFGFPSIGIAGLLVAWRQPVTGLAQSRLGGPTTWAYAALVVIWAGVRIVAPAAAGTPAADVLAALPLLPCLYAAVRVWRS